MMWMFGMFGERGMRHVSGDGKTVKNDEISLREAAELVGHQRPAKDQPGWSKDGKYKAFTIEERVDPESARTAREIADAEGYRQAAEREKRLREAGEATAELEAMLATSRHNRTVRGER